MIVSYQNVLIINALDIPDNHFALVLDLSLTPEHTLIDERFFLFLSFSLINVALSCGVTSNNLEVFPYAETSN